MPYTLSMTQNNTNKKNTIAYKVKFNANEIVVNDNSQSMFKSKHHIKKNYFRKIKSNSSVIPKLDFIYMPSASEIAWTGSF